LILVVNCCLLLLLGIYLAWFILKNFMLHNFMMSFVVTLHLFVCNFEYQIFILSCLYPDMRIYEFYKCRRCGFHSSTQVQMLGASKVFIFLFFIIFLWGKSLAKLAEKNSKFSQNCTGKTDLFKFFIENNFLYYKDLQKKKKSFIEWKWIRKVWR